MDGGEESGGDGEHEAQGGHLGEAQDGGAGVDHGAGVDVAFEDDAVHGGLDEGFVEVDAGEAELGFGLGEGGLGVFEGGDGGVAGLLGGDVFGEKGFDAAFFAGFVGEGDFGGLDLGAGEGDLGFEFAVGDFGQNGTFLDFDAFDDGSAFFEFEFVEASGGLGGEVDGEGGFEVAGEFEVLGDGGGFGDGGADGYGADGGGGGRRRGGARRGGFRRGGVLGAACGQEEGGGEGGGEEGEVFVHGRLLGERMTRRREDETTRKMGQMGRSAAGSRTPGKGKAGHGAVSGAGERTGEEGRGASERVPMARRRARRERAWS